MADEKEEVLPPHAATSDFGIDSDSECAQLHVMVLSNDVDVRVQLCQPVSYWTMPPEEAIRFAEALIRAANFSLELQREAAGSIH
jgi:hypothetical protein